MRRACAAAIVLAALLRVDLFAHAALRFSTPIEGGTLGDTPTAIHLTLTEKPEAALSEIHVIDRSGLAYDVGHPLPIAEDPLSLTIAVRPLPTGVYTVNWRVVSAIDGHATTGAYAFGVRQSPTGSAPSRSEAGISRLEIAARWALNIGLVLLIGAAFGHLAGFGRLRAVPLAAFGWLLATGGLALLLTAQQGNAKTSLVGVLSTSIGRALIWRAGALALAGVGLVVVARTRRAPTTVWHQAAGWAAVLMFALTVVAVHVASGHAAAAPTLPVVAMAAQWAHFAASGLWIGGLAALLLEVRGAASDAKAHSVSLFSSAAGAGIVVVLISGGARALGELTSWNDLASTTYGRTVLVKLALFVAIAGLGAANRVRSLPAARRDLGPLRRLGGAEVMCATAALAAAGLLATLAPPVSLRAVPGLTATGVDFATTVRVSFSAVSNQPGPNRFVANVADYDSRSPISGAAVLLRFAPADDPAIAATPLALKETAPGEYTASGPNLAFDGHWRVTVQIQRGANTVEVPFDAEVDEPPLSVEVQHAEGRVNYNALVRVGGFIRFSLEPERVGHSRLYVSVYDMIQDERTVQYIVATHASGRTPARTLTLQPLSSGRFVTDVDLTIGRNTFVVLARSADGIRARAKVEIDIPLH